MICKKKKESKYQFMQLKIKMSISCNFFKKKQKYQTHGIKNQDTKLMQ